MLHQGQFAVQEIAWLGAGEGSCFTCLRQDTAFARGVCGACAFQHWGVGMNRGCWSAMRSRARSSTTCPAT